MPLLGRSIAALLLLAVATPGRGACCPPRVISESWWPGGPGTFGPWLGADGLGGVHALSAVTSTSFRLTVSRDDGASFDAASELLLDGLNARASVNAAGHVVLARSIAGSVEVRTSLDQARTWSAPVVVAAGAVRDVMIDDTDAVALMWSDWDGTANRLHVAASADAGRSWSAPAYLTSLRTNDARVLTLGGVALAFWSAELAPDSHELRFSRTANLGAAWSPPEVFLTSEFQVRVMFDASGSDHAVVACNDSDGLVSSVVVRATDDAGASWSPGEVIIGAHVSASIVDVLTLPDGRDYVAWDFGQGASLSLSTEGGLPGTWTMLVDRPGGTQGSVVSVVSPTPGLLNWVSFQAEPGCTRCRSVYLDSSCDGGYSWGIEDLRLDSDAPPESTSSAMPTMVLSAGGRLQVAWENRSPLPGQEGRFHHLALEPPTLGGALGVTPIPGDACSPERARLELLSSPDPGCASPALQWFEDDWPLFGETGPVLETPIHDAPGPHEFHCVTWCADGGSCLKVGPSVTLDHVPLDSAVRDAVLEGVLTVAKTGDDVRVAWSDSAGVATGWNVYSGTIAALSAGGYDHAQAACHVPDAGGGASTDLRLGAGRYVLVSPADCIAEGVVGWDSRDVERPLAARGLACGPTPP